MTWHNDKRVNPSERHSNCKCVCTNQENCNICKAKTNRTGRRNKFKITVEDLNTPLSTVEKISRHKVSKDRELNNTINQQDLISIYRILHPITAEYTVENILFSHQKIIYQDKSYSEDHKTSTKVKELKLYSVCSETRSL